MSAVPYRRTFIRLLGFLRPYKGSLLVSTILAVLSQAAAIAIVLLVGEAIDGIDAQRGTHTLAWVVAAIVAVGIVKAVLMAGRRLISGRQALGIEKDMREGLYAHLLRLSFGFYDRHQTGQLMSRATVDLQSVRFFLGFGLIFFFQHVLTISSVMVVLFVIEWKLALLALAITPLIVAVAYRYSHVSHPVLRDVQQKLGDVATVTEESIVGVHVVKAFAQEERRQQQFEHASGSVFVQTVRAFRHVSSSSSCWRSSVRCSSRTAVSRTRARSIPSTPSAGARSLGPSRPRIWSGCCRRSPMHRRTCACRRTRVSRSRSRSRGVEPRGARDADRRRAVGAPRTRAAARRGGADRDTGSVDAGACSVRATEAGGEGTTAGGTCIRRTEARCRGGAGRGCRGS